MEDMRALLLVMLVSIVIVSVVNAAEEGPEILEVGEGSVGQVTSILEAKIENWGYERVFIAFPTDWEFNESDTSNIFDAYSYPVREHSLWRIYGMPYDKNSMLGRGEVFTGKGATSGHPAKTLAKIGKVYGIWLKPNEGVHIKRFEFKLPTGGGEINPKRIEERNYYPYVKVTKWIQEFTLENCTPGFIKAPWIVKGGSLTSTSPAPYGDARKVGTKLYYEKSKPKYKGKSWQEWIPFEEGLASGLKMSTLEYEIEKDETPKPVWRIEECGSTIWYEYEWYRDKEVEGIRLWRNDYENIPAWFEWF